MSGYLFSHPDVNNFFTGLRGLPNEEIHGDVQKYMNANPQVESEINGIRQPLTDLGNRCDYTPIRVSSHLSGVMPDHQLRYRQPVTPVRRQAR